VWLEFSERLPDEEIHHHDIVHFALDYLTRAVAEGQDEAVVQQLRDHLHEIQNRRTTPDDPHNLFNSNSAADNEKEVLGPLGLKPNSA
jgi:hypothetical protein